MDPEQQLYYCFGCKAGGTVISFIMEMERLSFPEAVRYLADQLHMPLPQMEDDPDYQRRRTQRERLLNANREAAQFFHKLLFSPQGAPVYAYLQKRGLSDGVIRKFGLGAAPAEWDLLTKTMMEKGYTLEELRLCGLDRGQGSGQSNPTVRTARPRRSFDMFRNRAIFPIIDQYGNVLGVWRARN